MLLFLRGSRLAFITSDLLVVVGEFGLGAGSRHLLLLGVRLRCLLRCRLVQVVCKISRSRLFLSKALRRDAERVELRLGLLTATLTGTILSSVVDKPTILVQVVL